MINWIDYLRDPENPYWPLPADYGELTESGQQEARLWTLRRQDTPEHLVEAWYLFRNLYLAGSTKVKFYRDGQLESPAFHSALVWAIGQYAMNAWAAPRGSAKSTVVTLEVPMLLALTRDNFDISLFFSTDKMKNPRFDTMMTEFTENELIEEDFGVMKPKRGTATWNHEYLQLTNGSTISGGSVMGKMRGGRPRLLIMDDPENDPDSDSEASRAILIDKFQTILFKKMIPMLKPGTGMAWIGTLIDRKSFLYQATMGDDSRFDYWNRVVLKAATGLDEEDQSKCHLLWPEMWSREFLLDRKEQIGAAAFATEYLNEPISEQDRVLLIDAKKNEYSVEGDFDWNNPLANTNTVIWMEREFDDCDHKVYIKKSAPFHELVRPMYKVLLFDYASGLTKSHDYSCIGIAGFDKLGTMWPLDLWLGRAKRDTLLRLIYEMGLKWQVRALGVEAVGVQNDFADAVQEYMQEQELIRDAKWRGRVYPVRYPAKESKGQRIASLEWRFNSGRIKYPAHLQNKWPWSELYAQTNDFTIDLALLPYDDAIDTIAMSKYVVKTRGGQFKRERGEPSLIERIKKNKPEVPGMPVLSGIPTSQVTDEMMNIMSQRARSRRVQPHQRRLERPHSRIITPRR